MKVAEVNALRHELEDAACDYLFSKYQRGQINQQELFELSTMNPIDGAIDPGRLVARTATRVYTLVMGYRP